MSKPYPHPPVGIPATARSCPPVSPLLATNWLGRWQRIGGEVTIASNGRLHPWFNVEHGCSDNQSAGALLAELSETPGLPAAIRIVVTASLRPRFGMPSSGKPWARRSGMAGS